MHLPEFEKKQLFEEEAKDCKSELRMDPIHRDTSVSNQLQYVSEL